MKTIWIAIALLSALTFAIGASASEFHGGEVDVSWAILGDTSPSPACHFDWLATPGVGEVYDNATDYENEPCQSTWAIHCSHDSLSYHGAWWTDGDPTDYAWNTSQVHVDLSANMVFTDPVRLYVASDSEGVLEVDSHQVIVTSGDGTEEILLGPNPGGLVEVELEPGAYQINLLVNAFEHHTHYDYGASLRVWWVDAAGVPVQSATWSGIKAIYR